MCSRPNFCSEVLLLFLSNQEFVPLLSIKMISFLIGFLQLPAKAGKILEAFSCSNIANPPHPLIIYEAGLF